MEVAVNQWKDTENEVEEVGFQRKHSLQRSSTSSSDTDIEGKLSKNKTFRIA